MGAAAQSHVLSFDGCNHRDRVRQSPPCRYLKYLSNMHEALARYSASKSDPERQEIR